MHCYAGKILHVDLSERRSEEISLSPDLARRHLGGRGLGSYFLHRYASRGVDPLAPENALIFMTGPLSGTSVSGSSRFCVLGKSPLTGSGGESYAGGHLAPELKYAGFDGVVITGASPEPVYLAIRDGRVEFHPAGHLWGKLVHDTEEEIRREQGDPAVQVATIGPAGERRIRFACVITDADRAAGRTGMGAVMGSKNLKALAVRGTRPVSVADPRRFLAAALQYGASIARDPNGRYMYLSGTSGGPANQNALGLLPTRNFSEGTFPGHDRITADFFHPKYLAARKACAACTVACIKQLSIPHAPGGAVIPAYGGPEYETLSAFGSLCENGSVEVIAAANQLCNSYGLDTISAGAAVAFSLECYEKGIITRGDVGFELRWGDPDSILGLLRLILARRGFGDLLAEGVRRAAAAIGRGAEEYAMEVKGLETPMHEPRGKMGLGISYAAAPRGATHMDGFHDTSCLRENPCPELGVPAPLDRFTLSGKPPVVKRFEDWRSTVNSLILCAFTTRETGPSRNYGSIVEMTAAATGWDLTLEEMLRIGERNHTLTRAYAVREGITDRDDRLPRKFARPMTRGPSAGHAIPPEEMKRALREYYRERGWDEHGSPRPETLQALGLGELVGGA